MGITYRTDFERRATGIVDMLAASPVLRAVPCDSGVCDRLEAAVRGTRLHAVIGPGDGRDTFRLSFVVDESCYLVADSYYNDKGSYELPIAASPDFGLSKQCHPDAVRWAEGIVKPMNLLGNVIGEHQASRGKRNRDGNGSPAGRKNNAKGKQRQTATSNQLFSSEDVETLMNGINAHLGKEHMLSLKPVLGSSSVDMEIRGKGLSWDVFVMFRSPWTYDVLVCDGEDSGRSRYADSFDTSEEDADDMGRFVMESIEQMRVERG